MPHATRTPRTSTPGPPSAPSSNGNKEHCCRWDGRPYATFATPPRHVYKAEDIDTLTHFTSSSQPW